MGEPTTYLSVREVARRLGVATGTLFLWRKRKDGSGPPWLKLGRIIRYPSDKFEDWLKTKAHV